MKMKMKPSFYIATVLMIFVLSGCSLSSSAGTPTTDLNVNPTAAEEVTQAPIKEPTQVAGDEPSQDQTGNGSGLPQATFINDEGGPVRLVGISDYTDFTIPLAMKDPSPALLDMVYFIKGDRTQFAPVESQILGRMTSPVVPAPYSYAFDLPARPEATYLDVDNDGEADQGVQIFWLTVGANINGDSYLQQLDQTTGQDSYLVDPITGNITEGSLLVYAPDNLQGFPSGFGDDGILFTEDDPAVGLPQGYTVVHFGPDGFTFDRSREAELNILQIAAAASSDFSNQSILESFNSLIDELAERYSFTEFRNLDWEAIQAQLLPQVEQLDQLNATDPGTAQGTYIFLLAQLAKSIRDAHVVVNIDDPTAPGLATFSADLLGPLATNLGANTTELEDGRIIVTDVLPDSSAAAAGWTFGTEIISVDGVPVEERLPDSYYWTPVGTEEGQRLKQVAHLLVFPPDVTEVTVEARLPDSTASQSFTLTPAPYPLPDRVGVGSTSHRGDMPIEYDLGQTYGYISWDAFEAPEVRIAVWEEFLRTVISNSNLDGIILDMRSNGGGWDNLYFTMASYFFSEENPVSMHWIDQDVYSTEAGGFVRQIPPEFLLSAPDPALYYDGPIVVLVDNNCGSSCEFFSQFLQTNGRATVVAQYGTAGAGAPINRVRLPGGAYFQYTKGRVYFAGTEEFNLEAKGVTPDVRVPTTEEVELAKIQGGDPVLDTAVEKLHDLVVQAFVDSITMVPVPEELAPDYTAIAPDGWPASPTSTGVNFSPANSQLPQLAYSTRDQTSFSGLMASLGISDPQAAVIDTRQANDLEWTVLGAVAGGTAYQIAFYQDGDSYHLIIAVSVPAQAEAAAAGLLNPAIDAFAPNEGN